MMGRVQEVFYSTLQLSVKQNGNIFAVSFPCLTCDTLWKTVPKIGYQNFTKQAKM